MKNKLDVPLILIAIAAFLAPLIGGQVAVDSMALAPGSDPILSAFVGASETPTLSHAILALLCTSALVVMLLRRKVLQVPNNTVSGLLIILLSLIVSTIGVSSFRYVSIPAGIEWVTYGICFYAVVAAGGRQRGPTVLLSAIFGGCVLLSLLGIREYGDMKAIDPTWRIFPQWVGPNAMAAVLVVGYYLGLGLAINEKRSVSLAISLGCVVIGMALFLTQSKGSLLSFAVGLFAFGLLLLIWMPKKELLRAVGITGGTLAAVIVLAAAITLQPKGNHSTAGSAALSPGARLVDTGTSADQSVGFRKLLWASAIKLTKTNPMGSGIGTFQFESARPGLTTQTHFAHESYLQLAAEASILAPLLLVAALLCWARLVFRGGSKLQSPQNVLRASVFASVLAIAGHSLIDSDFSYYGIGLIVFILLGVGLLLSSDAVAPEFLPAVFRRSAAGGTALLTVLLLFLGYVEGSRALVRGNIASKAPNDAISSLDSLRSTAPWDAEVWYLSAESTRDPAQQLEYAKKTVDLGPSTRNLRMLARLEAMQGHTSDALGSLERARELDPNNLQTLTTLAMIQTQIGEDDKAKLTWKKLVHVEDSGYFKVRSLPELIATDTYYARIVLAASASDPKEKIALLQPAVDGYKQYVRLTIPNVVRFAHNVDGPLSYGGERRWTPQRRK